MAVISNCMQPYCDCRLTYPRDEVGKSTGMLDYVFNREKQITYLRCNTCHKLYKLVSQQIADLTDEDLEAVVNCEAETNPEIKDNLAEYVARIEDFRLIREMQREAHTPIKSVQDLCNEIAVGLSKIELYISTGRGEYLEDACSYLRQLLKPAPIGEAFQSLLTDTLECNQLHCTICGAVWDIANKDKPPCAHLSLWHKELQVDPDFAQPGQTWFCMRHENGCLEIQPAPGEHEMLHKSIFKVGSHSRHALKGEQAGAGIVFAADSQIAERLFVQRLNAAQGVDTTKLTKYPLSNDSTTKGEQIAT